MNPNEKEIRDAVEVLRMCIIPLEPDNKSVRTLIALAQSYLSAASELPPREYYIHSPNCPGKTVRQCTCGVADLNEVVEEILDEVEPIVARLKTENAELKQELEACRDANVQKKKRIAELEKLVEERSVNTGWAKAVEIEQEKLVLINKIAELEDALKRAERKVSVEEIFEQIRTHLYFYKSYVHSGLEDGMQKAAQAIHALLTTTRPRRADGK